LPPAHTPEPGWQVKPAGQLAGHGLPHAFGTPPPPQVAGAVHEPHDSMLPQPSATEPQLAPACWQVRGVHAPRPHTFATPPPPHVSPETLHAPQSSWPPQVSLTTPQFLPSCWQVDGVQATGSQACCDEHWKPDWHVPHASNAPQPSLTCPQAAPSDSQVPGEQVPCTQTFAVPPAPQLSPGVSQVPQFSRPPQPSSTSPQFFARPTQVYGVQVPPLGKHWPSWHVQFDGQALQEPPAVPQAEGTAPSWHAPSASQHPRQLAGPHGGLLAPEHADSTARRPTTGRSLSARVMRA